MSELCCGVEYVPLGTVCEITKGEQINKINVYKNGTYPVINGGTKPTGYIEKYNQEADTITVAQGGAVGFVNWIDCRFWAGAHCFVLKPRAGIMNRFLYHLMKSREPQIQALGYGTTILMMKQSELIKFVVPLPPMEVQAKIVRALDTFTEYIALISRELDLRRQQYSYYLDKLLTFGENIPRVPLGELFHTRNGYTPSKRSPDFWENGSVPWFRMDDIRANGRILSDSLQHVTPDAVKGCPFPANSLIISTSATIGEHALITADFLANQRFTVLTLKEEYREKFNIMFLYYCCYELGRWCRKNTHKGSFESVDMDKFRLFRFPCPPLDVQAKIVSILNKWGGSHNGLIATLESELAARKKQYSHYLDKLLDFHTHIQD